MKMEKVFRLLFVPFHILDRNFCCVQDNELSFHLLHDKLCKISIST